jgi:hypothetical protein
MLALTEVSKKPAMYSMLYRVIVSESWLEVVANFIPRNVLLIGRLH